MSFIRTFDEANVSLAFRKSSSSKCRPGTGKELPAVKKADVFAALAGEMKGLGFRRRRSNYEYVTDLGDGFEGWCSFADAPKGSANVLGVATIVGIRSEDIEDRIQRWCGEVVPGWDGRSYVATVSMNVGYLTPRQQWTEHLIGLADSGPAAEAIAANLSDVTDIALPFMRQHASYRGVASALELGSGQLVDRVVERLPLALALQGDIEGAYRQLESLRERISEGSYLAPRYLRFLSGFERELPRS